MSKIPPKREQTNEVRKRSERGRSLGAGSEAAQGIHGARISADRENEKGLQIRRRGASPSRAGSEPLHHRSVEHKSGYGGEGGTPRTSSHERQQLGADGVTQGEE
jgi:hypothetical protein